MSSRAFNGSAQSDVRNLATSEAAFFADWQVYGVSAAAAAVGGGAGAIIVGPGTATDLITAADGGGTNRTLQVPLGNGVSAVATTNAGGVAIAVNTTFTAVSKHAQGDTYVDTDGDSSAMYVDPVAGSTGTLLVLGTEPASTAADDFAGVNGPSGINWTIK